MHGLRVIIAAVMALFGKETSPHHRLYDNAVQERRVISLRPPSSRDNVPPLQQPLQHMISIASAGTPHRSNGADAVASAGRLGRFAAHCAFAASVAASGVLLPGGNAVANTAPQTDSLAVALNKTSKRGPTAPRPAGPATSQNLRASVPVVTSPTTGPDQAGYIHYFVITHPDGETESQVGIELPGDRIAWSFPGRGVFVSPFIASGSITADGTSYQVEHLYGIRPFPDAQSMRVLQQELAARVEPWVDNKVPYCDEEQPSNQLCFSCLGFVLRILYPAASRGLPAFPPDFKSARKNLYTTEDLLLYLAGVPVDGAAQARLKRIEKLAVPESMREELARIAGEIDTARAAAAQQAARPASSAKTRATRPAVVDLPKRVLSRRRS